jgi:CheY-like chemotaxis protein
VLNLSLNARDAMPEGGKLTIEMANAALDDQYAARHAEVEPGQYVLVAMTDTGKGMDALTVMRALDPFFTTKPPGEGTGLGLPQVYGFVKQSGGHLKIYSEVGEGTTVKLYLPRSLGQATAQLVSPSGLAVAGSETVLLVDDDEIVRTTIASMLEDLGYTVLSAPSGTEALAILKKGGKIDLLFTDVVMLGVPSGRQLAEQALEIEPGLKILFTSGYTENAIVHNGRLDPGVELLSKPYGREQLAAKVRRVLDDASKAAPRAAERWRHKTSSPAAIPLPSSSASSSARIFGGDIGRSRSRAPIAAWIALATAAIGGTTGASSTHAGERRPILPTAQLR